MPKTAWSPNSPRVDSWQRDSHLMKAGWATFPGGVKPDNDVAVACAKLLITSLKIK